MRENLLKNNSAASKTWIIAIVAVVIIGIAGIAIGTHFLSIVSVVPSSPTPSPQTTLSPTATPTQTPFMSPTSSAASPQTSTLPPTSVPVSPTTLSPSSTENPTATATPTYQPSATQQPTPTPEPTPTPIVLTADLDDAVNEGFVQATLSGVGLTSVKISLKSTVDDPLEVTILPGTIFEAQSTGVQNMVVVEKRLIYLEFSGSVSSLTVPAACANMDLDQPDENNTFILSQDPVPGDLTKLLNLADFKNATLRVKQFAVWTITDNPPRDEYMGLATGFAVFGTGPSDEEMQQIRVLFEKADIPTYRYQALQ